MCMYQQDVVPYLYMHSLTHIYYCNVIPRLRRLLLTVCVRGGCRIAGGGRQHAFHNETQQNRLVTAEPIRSIP